MPRQRTASEQLLDRFKEHQGITSDYEVAKVLGVSRSAVSKWRNGGAMDEATALQIADLLKLKPLPVLAKINLDRKLTPRERTIWQTYAPRLLLATLVTLAAGSLVDNPAQAAHSQLRATSTVFDNLYIMRSCPCRRLVRFVKRFIANLARGPQHECHA